MDSQIDECYAQSSDSLKGEISGKYEMVTSKASQETSETAEHFEKHSTSMLIFRGGDISLANRDNFQTWRDTMGSSNNLTVLEELVTLRELPSLLEIVDRRRSYNLARAITDILQEAAATAPSLVAHTCTIKNQGFRKDARTFPYIFLGAICLYITGVWG